MEKNFAEELQERKDSVVQYLGYDLERNNNEKEEIENKLKELDELLQENEKETNALYLETKKKLEDALEKIQNTKNAAKYSIEQIILLCQDRNEYLIKEYQEKSAVQIQQRKDSLITENTSLQYDIDHKQQIINEKTELMNNYKNMKDYSRAAEIEKEIEQLKNVISENKDKIKANEKEIETCDKFMEEYMENLKTIKLYRDIAKRHGIELNEVKTKNPIPTPEPVPNPVPQPEPKPQPVPNPMPQPEPKPQPIPNPMPQPEPKPQPVPNPVPQPEPKPQPAPNPGPQPTPKPQPTPSPKPTPGTDLIPVSKPKKKKVKFVESAKNFYKKHKKAILLIGALAISLVALNALAPSIMYMNSWWWWKLVGAGAVPETGLPAFLHAVNLKIGTAIGASFTSKTGIWTLANGAILNGTAAEAGLLATVGKVALLSGVTIGSGAVAVKNAVKLATDKIKGRKNKYKHAKDDSIFATVTNSVKNGYSKGKEKVKGVFKKKDKFDFAFEREDFSDSLNDRVETLISKGYIDKETEKALYEMSREDALKVIKEADQKFQQDSVKNQPQPEPTPAPSPAPEPEKENTEELRTDLPQEMREFIDYGIMVGAYDKNVISSINKMPLDKALELIKTDPNYINYQKISEQFQEEKSEGKTK